MGHAPEGDAGAPAKSGGPGYTGNMELPSRPLTQLYGISNTRTYIKTFKSVYRFGLRDATQPATRLLYTKMHYIPWEIF